MRVMKVARFLVWVFPAANDVLLPIRSKDRRLLMIYDLAAQPFSIGDILVIQEASLVLRETWQLDKVDFALVCNLQSPKTENPVFAEVTRENVMYHLASVLPAAQTNPNLASLFVFSSHQQLRLFISNNIEQYRVWPSAVDVAGREYLLYRVFNDVLYAYFQEHGRIPHLSCREFLISWAEEFYEEHAPSLVAVTVQIRNNKKISPRRNLRMECWLELFRYCEGRYPVKFIVICSRPEIDERLRQCSNVIIAKDHLTSIEQDLALIHTAAFHMGAASGPGTMAVFGKKPYLLVNSDLVPDRYRDLIQTDDYVRFFFSQPSHRITLTAETTELLIEEFARMWADVEVDSWTSSAEAKGEEQRVPLSWLR